MTTMLMEAETRRDHTAPFLRMSKSKSEAEMMRAKEASLMPVSGQNGLSVQSSR